VKAQRANREARPVHRPPRHGLTRSSSAPAGASPEAAETVLENVNVATMSGAAPYGALTDAALILAGERIVWVGGRRERPPARNARVVDGRGSWVTPGLIDCHTHLVYAGNRANEFELRLSGASYEQIAAAGGGILATVRATRAASEAQLRDESLRRVDALGADGVTTVEIKSGYGLDTANELKMLRVARGIERVRAISVTTTLLGAHALPPEYSGRPDEFVALVADEMIPAVRAEGLADAVDAFCERIAFTPEQTRRVFEAAQRHGLPVKLHADQLSDGGGAALAASYRALSADHLEYTGAGGAAAMAAAGTVAVLLPGAFYYLREAQLPPIEALRRHRVPMALASDCNPGSSPIASLTLMLNMACTFFRLTPEEALAGVTRHAARALGMSDRGVLAPGMRADLALWDIASPAELAYQVRGNACIGVWHGGSPAGGRS